MLTVLPTTSNKWSRRHVFVHSLSLDIFQTFSWEDEQREILYILRLLSLKFVGNEWTFDRVVWIR